MLKVYVSSLGDRLSIKRVRVESAYLPSIHPTMPAELLTSIILAFLFYRLRDDIVLVLSTSLTY